MLRTDATARPSAVDELSTERTKRQELEARVGVLQPELQQVKANFDLQLAELGHTQAKYAVLASVAADYLDAVSKHKSLEEERRRQPAIESRFKEALSTSLSRAKALSRFEVLNDGPNRWVLFDNESDDPAPVYATEAEAYYNAALQLGFEPSRAKAMRA